MNEKSFAELFALVHDTSPTTDVPATQQGHVHKTMSDMVGASPGATDTCVLLGFLEPGDGAGGVYRHDASALKIDHDGSHVVDITKSFVSHADFLDTSTNNTSGTGCWIRQTDTWTPEMWGAKGDGSTDDSVAWNAFARFLAKNGGKGELSGEYLISSAVKININTADVVVEIVGTSDATLLKGGSGVTLFDLFQGSLIVRDLKLQNTTLFFTSRETDLSFDSVVLENISFDNTGEEVFSAALHLESAGSAIPTLKYFRAVGVRIDGGLGGIQIESAIERFHVDDYVCRNISVPNKPVHFAPVAGQDDRMKNLGYAGGLLLGADDAELVELTRNGYLGSVIVDGVQDDRVRDGSGQVANVDGVRIHAFNVAFDNIHVQNVDSHSKIDCTALYLKAHRCRGDKFTAIDAGFHEGMLTLKGDRRDTAEDKSPGFNVSINDVQLIGTQEGFSGRAGVFCGVDDVHIGRLYMENVGGQVEDPYPSSPSGIRLTGHGALFHAASFTEAPMERLSIGEIDIVDCTLGNEASQGVRAVELEGYREVNIGSIRFDGVSNAGGFGSNVERLILVAIDCDVPIEHCEIGSIFEQNTQLAASGSNTTLLEINASDGTLGRLVLRDAFITSTVFDNGIRTIGTETIDLIDISGGDFTPVSGSALNTSAREPSEIHIRGVRGLADLPAPDANDPVVSSFTGSTGVTDFTLSAEPISKAAILVSVDGVVQHQSAYTVASGTTLSFSAAPANGAAIEVRDFSLTAIADPEAVTTVANIFSEVQTIAGIESEITAVVADAADIGVVGAAVADVSTVAADIADVTTAAENLATIQAAPAAATSAASSASAAAASASTAETAAEGAATAALTDARIVTAQARFQNRFGKLPPSVLGLDLGEMSLVDLTRATVATTIAPRSGPETISANQARLTHDPETGEPQGLLLEPAGKNFVLNSEDLTSTSGSLWFVGNNLTRTTGATDPSGTTKAIRLTATADAVLTTSAPYFRTVTSSGSFTNGVSSWWIRRISGSGSVRILGLNNHHSSQSLDIGSQIDGTWRRFTHSGPPGGTFYYTGIAVLDNTDAVEVAFPQIEDITGTTPTSYIPTTGSAVTRSVDIATVDLSVIAGFRPDGFSMVVEAVIGASDGTLLAIGSGTTAEIALAVDSGDLKLTGTDSLSLTAAVGLSVGDMITVALRVQPGNVAVSVTGATVVTDTAHTMNGGADRMSLGADLTGSNSLPSTIRQVAFFGPLPNATLEAMSGS